MWSPACPISWKRPTQKLNTALTQLQTQLQTVENFVTEAVTYQTTVQNDVEAVKNTLGAIDWDAIENDAKAQREAQIDSAVEAALNETMQETSLSEEEQEILKEGLKSSLETQLKENDKDTELTKEAREKTEEAVQILLSIPALDIPDLSMDTSALPAILTDMQAQMHNRLRRNHERQHHGQNKAKRNFRRKCKRLFHALDIAARVVITDQRHNALRKAHCNLERHHVDALRDTHGRHRVRAIRGRKVVENGHAGHIQKVLDGSRDAHAAHALDNLFRWAEHGGLDAHVRLAALHEQQHEEVETRHGVGKAGRAARARRAEVQAPRQNENRVQHNVQQ